MISYLTKKLRGLLALATLSSLLSALLTLSLFAMVSQAKSDVLIGFDIGLYLVAWGGLLTISIGASTLLSRLSSSSIYQIRTHLIRRVLGTSYEKLEQAGSARIYNILNSDVTTLSNAFSELPAFVFNLILLVSCFAYLAFLSLKMFAVLAAAITLSFFISRTLIARLANNGRMVRDSQDAMTESYKGMLDGSAHLAVDAARKHHYYEHDLETRAQQLRTNERKFRFFWDVNRGVTVALVFLLLGVLIEAGRWLGDTSVLMGYALIVTYCSGPFSLVMNLLQLFAQARVSFQKIESLHIGQESELRAPAPKPAWRCLRFSKLAYAYRQEGDEQPFVLGPIDLEIRKGEVVFITGGNGSGKSTFVKLLLGLHAPSTGKLLMDNRCVQEDTAGYRELFSMIPSDVHVFREVLDAQGDTAQDGDVQRLLKRFNLDLAVKVVDGCFDTVRLSQGQKKRLALVSAICRDRDIYVLDEWAADQDPHYREVFYREIIPWLKSCGKTVIAVTHDDRYFDAADRRIDFEMGRIRTDCGDSDFSIRALDQTSA